MGINSGFKGLMRLPLHVSVHIYDHLYGAREQYFMQLLNRIPFRYVRCVFVQYAADNRPITIRHKEHIRYIKTNNPASAYATHILNNRHEYGAANDTLKLIQPRRKSTKMNYWESMYIQIYGQQKQLITEQHVHAISPLYQHAYLPRTLQNIL